jgi:hypothetical protein
LAAFQAGQKPLCHVSYLNLKAMIRSFLNTLWLLCLISCSTITVFNTPNDLRHINAMLYLANGDSIRGNLDVNSKLSTRPIKIYIKEEKPPMQFTWQEVTGYRVANDYYLVKQINGGITSSKGTMFMKRLTPADSRMHLFENMETIAPVQSKASATRYETHYYLQLPYEKGNVVWPINGSKFVPDFNKKLSLLLQDCPELSQKIARKKEGYFYPQISLFSDKRADVLMTIIEEYNRCR